MPHVVNGIGTWYTGKVNVLSRQDKCDFCGQSATLTSYDTTLYFVIFFIPIIPLGRKRIIEECSLCRRHRAMKLADWETHKKRAFEEATALWRQTPDDADAAKKLIGTYMGFHDNPAFMRAVPEIIAHLGGNAEILRVIASTYMLFGNFTQAEQILRVLISVEDTRQAREMLAETLIRLKQPAEAEPYLQHIVDEELPDRVGLLYLCAQGYQAVGDHAQALALFEQCHAIMPQLEANKEFKKSRKLSEKNRGRAKPLKIKGLDSGEITADAGSRSRARLAILIGPAILAVILFFYFGAAYREGKAREVWVVNGLSKPYVANINGAKVELPPARQVRMTLPEGAISVKSADPSVVFPESQFRIETPFWTRPFLEHTYVINPDQTAAVLWTQTHYAANPRTAPQGQTKAYFGKPFHLIKDVDYVFEPFPREISVPSGGGSTAKERISILREPKESERYAMMKLASVAGDEAAIEVAKRHLAIEPEVNEYIRFLSESLKPADFVEVLKPGLAVRPVLIETHRAYQAARMGAEPGVDLAAEYRALSEAEPGDGALIYLHGRVAQNSAERIDLFRKAAAAQPPCVWGHLGVALQDLTIGEFEAAEKSASQGLAIDPANAELGEVLQEALQGGGKLEAALELMRKRESEAPNAESHMVTRQVPLLCALGRQAEIPQATSPGLRMLEQRYGKPMVERVKEMYAEQEAYALGDMAKAAEFAARRREEAAQTGENEGETQTELHLIKGEPAQAEIAWREALKNEGFSADEVVAKWLTIAAAYHAAGDDAAAEKAMTEAVDPMREGDGDMQHVARLLAGEAAPIESEVLGLPIDSRTKRLVLASLGVKYPDRRKAFFDLARKLNYERNFPHWTIKAALEKE